ncbi:hypothetical protein ACVWYI_004969 [Bradyrhizobium sp. LB13.1]
MNGQYSTTPEMMAIANSRPIPPRNSFPGWPANMSVCSFRTISIGPTPTGPSSLVETASKARTVVLSGSPSTALLVKAVTIPGSSLSQEMYCSTRPGSAASAASATAWVVARAALA